MVAIVEQRDPRIADDALAWTPAVGARGYKNTYRADRKRVRRRLRDLDRRVTLPVTRATPKLRVTFEEFERIPGGAGHGRIVFTESIPLN